MTNRFKNKIKHLKYTILLLIAGASGACDKQTVYHAFWPVPQGGWKRQDTLLFDIAVLNSQIYYKLAVEIRNRNTYPHQNMNLSVGYEDPENKRIQIDTLKATLVSKEGIWKGDGWGGLYQPTFPAGSIKIGRSGNYFFKIACTSLDEILPGINDIGIKLRR